VAPGALQDNTALVLTPVAASAGFGDAGGEGGVGAVAVANDHTGPGVEPAALFATICQKYVVPADSAGAYDALAWPVVTWGGGLLAPNFTS
jgi:hypothetical protein